LNTITMFHQLLYKYTQNSGGEFKTADNQIIDRLKNGSARVRFQPPSASQTFFLLKV